MEEQLGLEKPVFFSDDAERLYKESKFYSDPSNGTMFHVEHQEKYQMPWPVGTDQQACHLTHTTERRARSSPLIYTKVHYILE